MTTGLRTILVGGYTKSGTTFVGRTFGILNGVYARGEMDYFRLIFHDLNKIMTGYNANIRRVNEQVYDGCGSLRQVDKASFSAANRQLFRHIFFNGEPVPEDCHTMVEKSPRNIFHTDEARFVFPEAKQVCVYRDSKPVFRSLYRHFGDHRGKAYLDPSSPERRQGMKDFCSRWQDYVKIVETNRKILTVVRYDTIAADTAGWLDFAQREILGEMVGLSAPVESLSKENYLKTLSPEQRKKSLVQTGTNTVTLTDDEDALLTEHCPAPRITFDF